MKAVHLALIAGLVVGNGAAAQSATDAERADAYAGNGTLQSDESLENLKPDYDGVIRIGSYTNASFVAMSPDALASAGFKTQRQAFVHQDVCAADLVVVATAAKAVSAFSASHKMIFTRVSFDHLQVLHAWRAVTWREPLTVMVMSGDLTVNKQRYVYSNNREPGYFVGTQYLLLLRADPAEPTLYRAAGRWPERSDDSLIARTYNTTPDMVAPLKADLERVLAQGTCRD